jgi:hypothetical protein
MTFTGAVAGFLVPGLGIYLRGRTFWGQVAFLSYGFLALLFFAGFGYPIGNFAFGLMLAIHATGFVYYCSPALQQEEFGGRLLFSLLALIAVGLLVYLPIRHAILLRLWIPLRFNGQVVVVQRRFPPGAIQRGDWIVYKLGNDSSLWNTGGGHGSVQVRSGLGLAPVLAVAGDRVMFSTNAFTVNGISHPLLPHMPQSGEVAVPGKNWFIWPSYSISGNGDENAISSMMLHLALVSEKDYLGKPYQRWLWRRQTIP